MPSLGQGHESVAATAKKGADAWKGMQRVLTLAVLATVILSGCASTTSKDDPAGVTPDGVLPPGSLDADGKKVISKIQDRGDMDFVIDPLNRTFSKVLIDGVHDILPAVGYTISVAQPVGSGLPAADVHMGVFFPDIEGCDFPSLASASYALGAVGTAFPDTSDFPEECRVPVIADIGPYWGEPVLGDVHAEDRGSGRLGEFMIQNFVPHGYAVAQVSVTGTGDSTGCMDLMGPVEQAGVQEAVRFLGDAGWSNGHVGLIGRSYDGSTPFEAAMAEDLPQLKTIVPISGLYGQFDLMWKNGSVETRGPGVLWGLYYAFTYTGNDPVMSGDPATSPLQARQIAENLVCAETQTGGALAAASFLYGGDPIRPYQEEGGYWEERSFKAEVLENYEGSVYFIHGMQDWNVDPHMAFPFYGELQAKGLDVKGLFGQWGHHYPDRVYEHPDNIRWDWAQDLLEWFDHYLMGTGAKPQLVVEMEDDHYQWRIEETWPPADIQWQTIELDAADGASSGQMCAQTMGGITQGCSMVFDLGTFETDTHIAGLPTFHVDVTPMGPGGQLGLTLRDVTENNRRIGHAIMDLRYADGGVDMTPVVPGQTITAAMEFLPFDAFIPAGHKVELVVSSTVKDYLPSATSSPVVIESGDLRLPIVERDGSSFYYPPGLEAHKGEGIRA